MRKTGVELLRIIAMLAVIMGHCLLFDIKFHELKPYTTGYFVGYFIKALTVPAVNCYMLITGYFLVNSRFKLKKLLFLYAEIWFYSVVVFLTQHNNFNTRNILSYIFPIQGRVYLYATDYMMVYCLAPLYNRSIASMTKKQMQISLIGLLVLFSVLPTLFYFNDTYNLNEGLSFVWLSVVYFTGAYIRLYPPKIKTRRVFLIYIMLLVWLVLQSTISEFYPLLKYMTMGYVQFHYKSPVVLGMSVCIFILFERIKWNSKVVVKIASVTFGIYLASEVVRKWVCDLKFMNELKAGNMWILHILLSTIIVFAICGLLDEVRKKLFNLLGINKFINGIEKIANRRINAFIGDGKDS